MTRILIADDHAIVRDGLRRILQSAPGIEVAGEAVSGDEVMVLSLIHISEPTRPY